MMQEKNIMVVLGSALFVLKEIMLLRCGVKPMDVGGADDVYLSVADGWGELVADEGTVALTYGKTIRVAAGCSAIVRTLPGHYPLHLYKMVVQKLELMEHSPAHRMFRITGKSSAAVAELAAASPHRKLQLLMKLEQLWTDTQGQELELQKAFQELLLEWDGQVREQATASHSSKLYSTLVYLQQNYMSRITREDAARRAGMNPDYFSVWFKKATGFGFSAYINRLRLERAKELLLTPGRTVQEAAEHSGFGDAFYFSRKFKELTGEAPSAFAARPKRIVALQHVGHLLALGIKPVGAAETYLTRWGVAAEELAETTIISEQGHVHEIAPLRPDLIIGHQYLGSDQVKRLRSIATTVIVPYNQEGPFQLFERFAELLGRQEQAEAFRARYREQAQAVKQRLQGMVHPDETVAYYEFRPPYVWLMSEANGRGVYNLYHGFGFRAPDGLQAEVLDQQKALRIELAQLPRYAADHMLIGVYEPDSGASDVMQQLREHPAVKRLPAVVRNRLHLVDLTAFSASDVFALYLQLQLQADHLIARN
jgi:ABC-type Fe3+-hydroxamate transport system substrate-binding protein